MNADSRDRPAESEKKRFLQIIEARLIEKQGRLGYIKRKIKTANESHRIHVSEQLLRAEMHADSSIEALRTKLKLLESADSETWPRRRFEVEIAWDELSQAIKKVVARFP